LWQQNAKDNFLTDFLLWYLIRGMMGAIMFYFSVCFVCDWYALKFETLIEKKPLIFS
jgi:hypothetical protein